MRKLWATKASHRSERVASLSLADTSVSPFLTTPLMYPTGSNTFDLALGDFNSDGKQDAVLAANPPLLLLGNGDGSFQTATPIGSISITPSGVAVADFNHDGKLDVAFSISGAAVVFLGNGDGTFAAGVSYSSAGTNQNVVPRALAGDVNGDNLIDLVLDTDSGISVLLGNGDGTFRGASTSPASVQFMAAADFNKDGHLDLAVTNGFNTLSILLGNGKGKFIQGNTYSVSGVQNLNSVVVLDVDRDRNLDIALPNGQIFLGKGDGTFTPGNNFQTTPQSSFLATADLNGDGIADLVTATAKGSNSCDSGDFGTTGVAFGNGDGSFQPVRIFDSGGCFYPVFIAGADLNGDGSQDLAVLSGRTLSVLTNLGNGTFPAAELNIAGGSGGVAVGDFNRDGNSDLALADGTVYLGNGDGALRFVGTVSLGAVAIASGDFNHDGKPDLAAAVECATSDCTSGGQLLIALGNGDGTFQLPTVLSSGGFYAESLTVADFNHDGTLDIAVLNNCADVDCSTGGALQVFVGSADGTFAPGIPISLADLSFQGHQFPVTVITGDFNNDGIADLAVAGSDPQFQAPGSVAILFGNGDASFQDAVNSQLSSNDGVVALVAGDFDQDGILDLGFANGAACGDCGGHGSIMYGKGDGTFTAGPIVPTEGGPPVSIVASDFFGTGTLTPVLANRCEDFLDCPTGSVMINGTFNQTNIMLLFLGVGDFNNDGKPDLVGSLQYDAGASVLLNVDATSSATTTTASPATPQSALAFAPVTLTAQVLHTGPGTPTNTVSFFDNGVSIGSGPVDSSGKAEFVTHSLAVGSHFIVPYYNGDSSFAASNALGVQVTVGIVTTTTLTSSANPSYPNQAVTYTAQVASQGSAPLTGNLTFKQAKTTLAIVSLSNGQATYTTTYPATGARQITATYSGDSKNLGSTSEVLKQTIAKLPAATVLGITSSINPSFINTPVTFTATITSTFGPIPDGETVTFSDGATQIGSGTTAGGAASFSTSTLTAKTHTVKATYPGDATFKSSSNHMAQVVNLYSSMTTVTSNSNPSTKGQFVALTAAVQSGNPHGATGQVVFKNDTQTLGSAQLVSGVATLNTSRLPAGNDSITAMYNGDSETAKSASGVFAQSVH